MAGKYERAAFIYKKTSVFDALFLKERVPTYFTGCSASILKLIEKKVIPQDQYFFAGYTEKSGYKECSPDYKARRLLIKADWVNANVPGFGSTSSPPVPSESSNKPVKVYPPAPVRLFLHDEEKFTDEDGNIIDIEVRGERRHDAIWFKARHIEKMLEMDKIHPILTKADSKYTEGKHYQTFNLMTHGNEIIKADKIDKSKLSVFLSHAGLMMLLHRRQHPIADRFRDWASKKLFTIRHGTQEQKQVLAAELLEMTPRVLRAALNTSSTAMSALYLFELGQVKTLRETFNIPEEFSDDQKVYKFGMTEDLSSRTQQHENYYGKMQGVKLVCVKYTAIDPNHLTVAEQELKLFFEEQEMRLPHSNFRELAVISDRELKKTVYREYKDLGERFAGRMAPLKKEIDQLMDKVAMQQKHMENMEKHIEEMEKHRVEIDAMHRQNIELHKELQRKAEDNVIELKELYKSIIAQKEELLAVYRAKE